MEATLRPRSQAKRFKARTSAWFSTFWIRSEISNAANGNADVSARPLYGAMSIAHLRSPALRTAFQGVTEYRRQCAPTVIVQRSNVHIATGDLRSIGRHGEADEQNTDRHCKDCQRKEDLKERESSLGCALLIHVALPGREFPAPSCDSGIFA